MSTEGHREETDRFLTITVPETVFFAYFLRGKDFKRKRNESECTKYLPERYNKGIKDEETPIRRLCRAE